MHSNVTTPNQIETGTNSYPASRSGGFAIEEVGDLLLSTGHALETIANLLGCDGSEHNLSREDISGLTHAIRVIAGFASATGGELCWPSESSGMLGAE